jgi:hypothetical protein
MSTDESLFGGELVKPTWVTRVVPADVPLEWRDVGAVAAGDLLLCEVKKTGLHGRVETTSGSRRKLYVGDRIVCAVANRYATSLLEAVAQIEGKRAHMIAASGLCGRIVAGTQKASNPTLLRVVSQAFAADEPLNLRMFRRVADTSVMSEPRWIVVVGSAMDSGKTTACAAIIRGLVEAGHSVAGAKMTGTASGRDFGAYADAGAFPVVDFLDAGVPTTAGCSDQELARIAADLAAHIRAAPVDFGVIEIADGLLQRETRTLLSMLNDMLPEAEIVLTARESMAAASGIEQLRGLGYSVVAASGLLTNSPLIAREVELATDVAVVRTSELGTWFAARAAQPADAEPVTVPRL